MRATSTTTLVAAVAAGVALLSPGAAHAATRPHSNTHVDAARDVAVLDDAGSNGGDFSPAPTRSQGDVLSFTSTHASSSVRMSARLGDLIRPESGNGYGYGGAYGFAIRTSSHRSYAAVLQLTGTSGTRFQATLHRGNGGQVRCRLVGRIDAASKTVGVIVPRSCLGRPGWVRTGVGSVGGSADQVFIDDARTTGASPRTLDTFPSVGPRLFH